MTPKQLFSLGVAALADIPYGFSGTPEVADSQDARRDALLKQHEDTLRKIGMDCTDDELVEVLGTLEETMPPRGRYTDNEARMEHIERVFAQECERREMERVEGQVRFPRVNPHVNPHGEEVA